MKKPCHDALEAAVRALRLDRMGQVGEVLGSVINQLMSHNQQLEKRVSALEDMAAFGLEPMSTEEMNRLNDDLLDRWPGLSEERGGVVKIREPGA
jgi:hypothetical protein